MNFINIKSKEKFPTLILFVMFFSIVAASITGSTIKDSTFLTYFEKSYLPIMYVIIAITMAAVIYFYKKLSFQKDQTNVILSTSLISLVLISFFKDNLMGWYIPFFYFSYIGSHLNCIFLLTLCIQCQNLLAQSIDLHQNLL